jgi:hypothetical protein
MLIQKRLVEVTEGTFERKTRKIRVQFEVRKSERS